MTELATQPSQDLAEPPTPLVFTDSAAAKVADLIAEEGNPELKLRVFVQGGGCSGFQYGFTFDDAVNEDDTLFEKNGVTLLVDTMSFQYLVGAEIEMINLPKREEKMKESLMDVKDMYDFIIIDCSPSLGLIVINSLTAADSVIVPVQCEYFALEGLGKLLNTIKIIQQRLNPALTIEGILLTMYDLRVRLSNQVVHEVTTHFKNMVFQTLIPRNIRLSESPSYGVPALAQDADSKGAISYLNLAREILVKNGKLGIDN